MKKIIILIVCVLSACFAAAQEPVPVLTLGTFHFDFPNLDQVQYAESEQIDVLNPVYQNEIETLVGLLEKFAPTIIVIERPVKMQFETDSLFRRYLADCYDLQRGEDEQIGFRLAKPPVSQTMAKPKLVFTMDPLGCRLRFAATMM